MRWLIQSCAPRHLSNEDDRRPFPPASQEPLLEVTRGEGTFAFFLKITRAYIDHHQLQAKFVNHLGGLASLFLLYFESSDFPRIRSPLLGRLRELLGITQRLVPSLFTRRRKLVLN